MVKVVSALKRYNANSHDRDTGDCVKRSLSMAYGMDYDEVASELRKLVKRHGSVFNSPAIYRKFIKAHGCKSIAKPSDYDMEGAVKLSEFAEAHPQGTYLIEVSKKPNTWSTHIVALIDGDVWDSWDSQNWYVDTIYCVTTEPTSVNDELEVDEVREDVVAHIEECLDKAEKKMPYALFEVTEGSTLNKYTFYVYLKCKLFKDEFGFEWGKYDYIKSKLYYNVAVKINPRLSRDENIVVLKNKLWNRVREWAYTIRKEIEDKKKVAEIDIDVPHNVDKELLIKMPREAWNQITELYYDPNVYYDKYTCYMNPDTDDLVQDEVHIPADTLTELKNRIIDYKEHHMRFGYHY